MVSGSSDSNKDKRVEVLKLIQKKKDILFGNGGPPADKNIFIIDKHHAWQDITAVAQSMGCYPPDKDWKYLRDTTWQNWRKRVVEKREKIHAAAAQHRNKIKYDYADLLILDIIGSKSHPLLLEERGYKLYISKIKSEASDTNADENEYQENAFDGQQYQEQYQDQQKYDEQQYEDQQKYSDQQYPDQQEEPVEEYVEEEVIDEQEMEHPRSESIEVEEECPDEPIISMTTDDDEVTPTYPVNYLQKLSQSVDANTSIPGPIKVIRESLNVSVSPQGVGSASVPNTPMSNVSNAEFFKAQTRQAFIKANNIAISRKRPLNSNRLFPTESQDEDLKTLQKNKIRLEIKLCAERMRLTERERYKMDLELLKLERELKLPPSKFTRNFRNQ